MENNDLTVYERERLNYNELKKLEELRKKDPRSESYFFSFLRGLSVDDLIWMKEFILADEEYEFGFDIIEMIDFIKKEKISTKGSR